MYFKIETDYFLLIFFSDGYSQILATCQENLSINNTQYYASVTLFAPWLSRSFFKGLSLRKSYKWKLSYAVDCKNLQSWFTWCGEEDEKKFKILHRSSWSCIITDYYCSKVSCRGEGELETLSMTSASFVY